MKIIASTLSVLTLVLIMTSCSQVERPMDSVDLSFKLLSLHNSALTDDINFKRIGDTWVARVPLGVDLDDLVASWISPADSDVSLSVGHRQQGHVAHDFSRPMEFEVIDGEVVQTHSLCVFYNTGQNL